MTPTECVQVVQFLAARCPAMRLEEATPDAWYLDLAGMDYTDTQQAVAELTRRQPFVSLHEIIAETDAIARRRLGQQRRAELDAQLARELAEGSTAERLVADLIAANPLKSP